MAFVIVFNTLSAEELMSFNLKDSQYDEIAKYLKLNIDDTVTLNIQDGERYFRIDDMQLDAASPARFGQKEWITKILFTVEPVENTNRPIQICDG